MSEKDSSSVLQDDDVSVLSTPSRVSSSAFFEEDDLDDLPDPNYFQRVRVSQVFSIFLTLKKLRFSLAKLKKMLV
jgi:hypothetical protein